MGYCLSWKTYCDPELHNNSTFERISDAKPFADVPAAAGRSIIKDP